MSDRRERTEEVWKSKKDGKYYGMQTGNLYEKNEVEEIDGFTWSKPCKDEED